MEGLRALGVVDAYFPSSPSFFFLSFFLKKINVLNVLNVL